MAGATVERLFCNIIFVEYLGHETVHRVTLLFFSNYVEHIFGWGLYLLRCGGSEIYGAPSTPYRSVRPQKWLNTALLLDWTTLLLDRYLRRGQIMATKIKAKKEETIE